MSVFVLPIHETAMVVLDYNKLLSGEVTWPSELGSGTVVFVPPPVLPPPVLFPPELFPPSVLPLDPAELLLLVVELGRVPVVVFRMN